MKRTHFEALKPLCPTCLVERGVESALNLAAVAVEHDGDVIEGMLRCTSPSCQTEHPILDGIPILLPKIDQYVKNNADDLLRRDDLSPLIASYLGDQLGQGSTLERARSFLSSYSWGHYGDLDPHEPQREEAGSVLEVLQAGLDLAGVLPPGPLVDAGCSVGRTTFELAAARDDLVLGVDVNFAMLRVASRVLRQGVVRYPRRRVGLVYDERSFKVDMPGRDRVDFWACDAQALPFRKGTFAGATSLNVLDCVSSPPAHLQALGRVLRPGAPAIVTTPYEWSEEATPLDAWLGGRSQRGASQGRAELVLRALLDPQGPLAEQVGLYFDSEAPDVPWRVRLHDRGILHYSAHVVVARAPGKATE